MGYPQIWYRIDKGTGEIAVSSGVNVVRAASGAFKKPNHAIATGRFQTPFAYYSTGDNLTAEEDKALAAAQGRDVAECGVCGRNKPVCCDNGYINNEDGSVTHTGAVCVDCCGPHKGSIRDGKSVAGGTYERCE